MALFVGLAGLGGGLPAVLARALPPHGGAAGRREGGSGGGGASPPGGPAAASPRATAAFRAFRISYVALYSLMMAGDWLQGPYIYRLYSSYGYEKGSVARLFIAGFCSSMVFGTAVGALGDRYGRKRMCLAYAAVYSLACLTKHSSRFGVLLVGRMLAGVATSLLFSAFEAWLVAAHAAKGFDAALLGSVFSAATLYGNGLAAIVAGVVASFLVDGLGFGLTAPFDLAILCFAVGGAFVASGWDENFGAARHAEGVSLAAQLGGALGVVRRDRRVLLLGGCQALFEATMYIFVFLWTPALSPRGERVPHGFVFATFMLCCMIGSSCVGALQGRRSTGPLGYMGPVFLVAAAALATPAALHVVGAGGAEEGAPPPGGGGIGAAGRVQVVAFCVFEACVGAFWPSLMQLRSVFVPEDVRATVINLFRVPLNLFVCVVLFNVELLPLPAFFGLASLLALGAHFCLAGLRREADKESGARL